MSTAPARYRSAIRPPPRRAAVRPDRVYLGWQYAPLHPDPGPLPRRPAPPAAEQVNQGWVDAQRREDRRLSRPAKVACASALAAGGLLLALGLTGVLNASLTGTGVAAGLAVAAAAGRHVRRDALRLQRRIDAEQQRVAAIRAVQQSRLAARQEQHARQVRAWEARREAFDRQLHWYAVWLPGDIDRIDVAGGTLAGWSALLTMIAAPRLSAGGDVTILDLTEGAVARDLLAVARRSAIEPLVWVMPGDLPRLTPGAAGLAEVLAATVAASDEPDLGQRGSPGSASIDHAILERVAGVLGETPTVAQIAAALRALGQVGDPREDLQAGLLTPGQLERVTALYGRGAADRVVIERALAIESRLRTLERLGSAPVPLPASRLRVASLDRRAGALGNRVLGSYLTAALTQALRQAPASRKWRHTVFLLGGEKLRGEVIDRLTHACEVSGTGLVIGYRTIPAHVRERLGRGNAALAFMRLGNADDARVASEQIGTEHRFVVSQLTDTVGTSITDTAGGSYTSTVATSDSVSDSASVTETRGSSSGRGRTRQDSFAPFGHSTGTRSRDSSQSLGSSDTQSISVGISLSTAWGVSTSRAAGASSSAARTTQRTREFLVEQHELQRLPPSAVIVTYASPEGRRVVLADANPGIIALRSATLLSLDEVVDSAAAGAGHEHGQPRSAGGASREQPRRAGQRPAEPRAGQPGAAEPTTGDRSAGEASPAEPSAGVASPAEPSAGQPGQEERSPGQPGQEERSPGRPGQEERSPGTHAPGLSGTDAPPNLGPPPERLDWRKPR